MDNLTARKYFFEKKILRILRYISYLFLGFGLFSCIFLWQGVEIGTPFLIAGGIIYYIVSAKTVSGKHFIHYAESILSEELEKLEALISSKEKAGGAVITSKQFLFDSDASVKKAAKNKLVSSLAQAAVVYCNEKTNRIRVLVTRIDFSAGSTNTIDVSGELTASSLTKSERSFVKLGCSVKQLGAEILLSDKSLGLILNDDYTTHKFIDDLFVNRRIRP